MVLFVSALIESRNLDLISFNLDELISLPYALKIKKLFETNKNDQIISYHQRTTDTYKWCLA
jgi:hypothetical protein